MTKLFFEQVEGVLQVKIVGEINLLQSSELKEDIYQELARTNTNKLLLELSEVPWVDSSGLGMFIGLFKHINQKQGQIVLVGVTDYVQKTFRFAKLDMIFLIAEDIEQGMKLIKE